MKTLKKWLRVITPLVGNLTNVAIIFFFLNTAHGPLAAGSGAVFFELALMVIAGVAVTDEDTQTLVDRLLFWHLALAVVLAVYGGWMYLAIEKPELNLIERGLTALLAGAPFPVVNYFLTKVIFSAKDLDDTSEIQEKLLYHSTLDAKTKIIKELQAENAQKQTRIDEISAIIEQKQVEITEKSTELTRITQERAAKPSAEEQRALTAKQIGVSIVSRQLRLSQVVQSVLDKKEGNKRDAAEVLGIDVRTLNRLLEV